MKEETRSVFVADDGKVFETAEACEAHEINVAERAARTTYWKIIHSPDLTEGRGATRRTYVECYGPIGNARLWVVDWCYRLFGRPIAYVQGVAPTPNWIEEEITREEFLAPVGQTVGDFKYDPLVLRLVIGSGESGLVEEQPR